MQWPRSCHSTGFNWEEFDSKEKTMAACATAAWPIPQSQLRTTDDLEASIDPTAQSDDALVEAAKMGETGAFAQLIERYQRLCLSKAYSILRNHGDAEDEVQSAWVQAWTHLE